MIIRRMRKILSSTIIGIYLMVYVTPISLCATALPPMPKTIPTIETGISKPVLRSGTTATKRMVKKPSSSNLSALKLEGDLSITKGNPKISLSLRNSDVQQVLRMFADKAGLNIVFHQSVKGKVTLDLVNVSLNDAFKLVMQVSNLTYYVDNNTMVVISADAAKTLNLAKREMVSIPVKYVNSVAMANFLNTNIFSINEPGLSNSQIAVTNPVTNEVLIFGTDNDVRMARKVIAKFDIPVKETQFVINHTTPKEMANQLCSVLFPAQSDSTSGSSSSGNSSSGTSGSSGSSSSSGSGSSSGSTTGGAANSDSGVVTGGASSSSSSSGSSGSSSGSSGSSSSSSSSSGSGITLGANVIACQYKNQLQAGNLSSFGANNMTISYYPSRGMINVMGGTPQQLQMIKNYISMNDKKEPQAYLEVSIVELSDTGTRQFDNTWQIWSKYFSANFSGGSLATNQLYPTFFKGEGFSVVDSSMKELYKIAKFNGTPTVAYSIDYLVKNQKGRVLANPKIMITNGKESVIDLTSDYVKTVTSQVLSSTSSTVSGAIQRTYEIGNDNGIKVNITPFISPDGYVTLNLKPDYATIKDKVYGLGADGKTQDLVATLLERRNLDLKNIRIKDGETLVIGGMIREDEQKSVSKFPVLGEIPGIGFFFRNTDTTKERQELVIMITPRIIKDSEDVVGNTNTAL